MNNDLQVKVCQKCQLPKHIDEFSLTYNKDKTKSYRRNSCKACTFGTKNTSTPKKNYTPKPVPDSTFTEDEIIILKQLIETHQSNKYKPINEIINDILDNNIKKVVKTYTMHNDLINKINEFCSANRIAKSDLINLAVKLFFENYN